MKSSTKNPALQFIKMKKAQLQIMENAFVLLAIFFILMLAVIFVAANQRNARLEKLEMFKERDSIKKSRALDFLPEMTCSEDNVIDPNCYDILKIIAFKELIQEEQLYYNEMLGNIYIIVRRFDPSPENPNYKEWVEEWIIYNNTKAEYKGHTELRFPVLLRDVIDGTSNPDYFGVIYLGVYE